MLVMELSMPARPGAAFPILTVAMMNGAGLGLAGVCQVFGEGHPRAFVVGLLPLVGLTIGCVRSAHQCRASGR